MNKTVLLVSAKLWWLLEKVKNWERIISWPDPWLNLIGLIINPNLGQIFETWSLQNQDLVQAAAHSYGERIVSLFSCCIWIVRHRIKKDVGMRHSVIVSLVWESNRWSVALQSKLRVALRYDFKSQSNLWLNSMGHKLSSFFMISGFWNNEQINFRKQWCCWIIRFGLQTSCSQYNSK